MILADVNVLVYAHRPEAADHDRYRAWIEAMAESDAAYAVSDLVLSGFLRIVTHPRVFRTPTPLEIALSFVEEIRDRANAVRVAPGGRHFSIFTGLLRKARARGNLVPDAWFAALAIETGCTWVTADRDYARFPGLRWRHPLDGPPEPPETREA